MNTVQMRSFERIGFIGGGNMARALIGGLLARGWERGLIQVGEPRAQQRATLQAELGVQVSADNHEALRGCSLLVLAVKPQELGPALRPLRAALAESQPVLLSIAAGARVADLQRFCPGVRSIVRAMPNRPALVGAGAIGLYAAASVDATGRDLAEQVAGACGRAVWLREEAELDIVTALSGSGPAYFFLLAEHLARAAERLGLSASTAALLASQTLYGAGMLAHTGGPLAEQRAAVTSKGGTTEAALQVFDLGGFEALTARALSAASERAAQLAEALSGTH